MAGNGQLCFDLKDFEQTIKKIWQQLQNEDDFYDVTLACDDGNILVHKLIIASCSSVLKNILKSSSHKSPYIYLRGVKLKNLNNLISFIYQGEVKIDEANLQGFVSLAEDLKVKGLSKHYVLNELEQNEEKLYNDTHTAKKEQILQDQKYIANNGIQNLENYDTKLNAMELYLEKEFEDSINLQQKRAKPKHPPKYSNKNSQLPILPDPIFNIKIEESMDKGEKIESFNQVNGDATQNSKENFISDLGTEIENIPTFELKYKESVPKKQKKLMKAKGEIVSSIIISQLPSLPTPNIETSKEQKHFPNIKDTEENINPVSVSQIHAIPLTKTTCSPKEISDQKKIKLSLTFSLIKEPHKFRFFHRAIGRKEGVYKKNTETEEEFQSRKSMFFQFPGLIADGELTKLAVCIGCGFIGKTHAGMLRKHFKICPNDVEHLKNKEIEIIEDFKYKFMTHNEHFEQVKVDKIECNYCKELFTEMNVFKIHLREAHHVKTNGRKFKNTFGSYQCTECGKKFMKNDYLKQHEITIHGRMELVKHQCDKCGAKFNSKGKYTLHWRKRHSDERPYMCDICSKSFRHKKLLDNHRNIHTQEKSWQCSHCEKSFSKDWTLTQHERLHLGIKPYKCKQCEMAFSQKNSLDSHEKIHHRHNNLVKEADIQIGRKT